MKVFRTWGFNDKNATTTDGGMPDYGGEGAGPTDIIFQRWSNGTSTIDLKPFDKVVHAAEQTGMKLIVALVNNWADYGGMDVYTVNLGGQYHDDVSWIPFPGDSLLTPSPVLSSSQDQERLQAVRQGVCHAIPPLPRHHGLGAGE